MNIETTTITKKVPTVTTKKTLSTDDGVVFATLTAIQNINGVNVREMITNRAKYNENLEDVNAVKNELYSLPVLEVETDG